MRRSAAGARAVRPEGEQSLANARSMNGVCSAQNLKSRKLDDRLIDEIFDQPAGHLLSAVARTMSSCSHCQGCLCQIRAVGASLIRMEIATVARRCHEPPREAYLAVWDPAR